MATCFCQTCGSVIAPEWGSKEQCRDCLTSHGAGCRACGSGVVPRDSVESDDGGHPAPYFCPDCEEPRMNSDDDLTAAV